MSNLLIFNSEQHNNNNIIEFKTTGKVAMMFSAKWCPPCKKLFPEFEKLSATFSDVKFAKVDCDDFQEAASFFDISAMPTFMFFKDGKCIDTMVGATSSSLKSAIEKLSSNQTSILDVYTKTQ